MNKEQNSISLQYRIQTILLGLFAVIILFTGKITDVQANELALQSLGFSVMPGQELQLQLEMSGPAVKPNVFQTDNPARIALDFTNVKSGLDKKMHPVNIGAVRSVYTAEANGKLRVIINLVESVPYSTTVEGNKVYVTIQRAPKVSVQEKVILPVEQGMDINGLIPEQAIKGLDFRRGPNGEGRLIISLTNPNTVVDSSEKGGKVILNFLNTKLPKQLAKRLDVVDFATPVQFITTAAVGSKVRITVTPRDGNYEYSSYQTDGLLTVEFRRLTADEKKRLQERKFPYTGERLSLNFQDIEVRSVLQILADFTDLNIIVADSVDGAVTLRLNDVPWDQALALILKSKGLGQRKTGNVIWVATKEEIIETERKEFESQKAQEQIEPLKTEYVQINFAKAENFRNLLIGNSSVGVDGCSVSSKSRKGIGVGKSSLSSASSSSNTASGEEEKNVNDRFKLLSERGTAIVDARTNTLIVRDTMDRLQEIRDLISLLDKPVRQVLIESRIVIAADSFAKEIGVNLGIQKKGDVGGSSDSTSVLGGLVDLATTSTPHGTLAMTLLRAGDYLLNLEITALQDEGRGEILSNPRVLTSDRCEAYIKQGVEIPYQTVSQNGTQTELIEAVLEMKVTPQITPSDSVMMDLAIKKDSPNDEDAANDGNKGLTTREINTSVLIENGETVVLGGVYENQSLNQRDTVPFFSDIPGIGWLFTRTRDEDDKKELLIFITPKIVKSSFTLY